MTDKDIEYMIKQAVEEETPDILDDLLNETGLPDKQSSFGFSSASVPAGTAGSAADPAAVPKKRPWRHLYTALVTAAAVILIFTLALNLSRPGLTGQQLPDASASAEEPAISKVPAVSETPGISAPSAVSETPAVSEIPAAPAAIAPIFASVCIDVNPSVELAVDTDDRVSSCRAVNDDGRKILSKLDLAGTDITTASYALIGVMLTDGYLNNANNSVLLSVISDDTGHGTELEKDLSSKLSSYLKGSVVDVAILGQYAKEDTSIREFADANGISEGKARIIKELSSSDPGITEESLLMLSTHELMLVWNDHLDEAAAAGSTSESGQTVSSYGTVSTISYISRDDAAALAIAGTGADPASVSGLKTEFECQDGIIIYEVGFRIGNTEYEAVINAVTGELLSLESESSDGDSDNDDDDLYEQEYDVDNDDDDYCEDREDDSPDYDENDDDDDDDDDVNDDDDDDNDDADDDNDDDD